jgi:hypothetical protein
MPTLDLDVGPTMKAHASAVKDDSFLVNDLVVRSKTLLTFRHDGLVDKLAASDMIID